jgi:hypothetical protein
VHDMYKIEITVTEMSIIGKSSISTVVIGWCSSIKV